MRDHGSYLFVGRHSANSRHPGVRLLRDELSPHDIELIDGVLLTTRARAVFDCLRLLTEQQAEELLDRALQRRWITIDGLVGRVRAFTGRRGAPRLVRLVRMAASGARSPGERLLIDLLIRAGISGWTANHPVADAAGHIGDGDVVFPKLRLVLELDGWAYHTTPDRFRSDRERQNRFVAAGWTVLRFTWHDVTNRPDYVIATVKAMISRLSTHAH